MQENGRRRVPPGTLQPKIVSRLIGVARTNLYREIRAGNVPVLNKELTGASYRIPTIWVAEEMSRSLGREVTLDEVAAFLPEELLA